MGGTKIMQRHFSNRGEALAEVTAARMLARRKRSGKFTFAQAGRGGAIEKWFSQPVEPPHPTKRKQPKRSSEEIATLL
jgi:hypothetical protein